MSQPNLMVITGNNLSSRYFINHLCNRFPVSSVLIENNQYPEFPAQSREEQIAWKEFFINRDHYQKRLLAKTDFLNPRIVAHILRISSNQLNAPKTIEWIKYKKPGMIALFGTGLLNKEFIRNFENKLYNLHVGFPSHYRGSSCNFWPIFEEKLDYLGATIHQIDSGIDTGKIVNQQAITLEENDNVQILLAKTLILGTQLMIEAIEKWMNHSLVTHPSTAKGRLYLKKEFTPQAVLKVMQMEDSGKLKNLIRSLTLKNPDLINH